jgi:hypothetical protein
MASTNPKYWPSARHFNEAIQCPGVCFSDHLLRATQPAIDRLGMPLVTSGQFAYVYKLKSTNGAGDFAVRCFRGYLGDRDQRYRAIQQHIRTFPLLALSCFTYEAEGILVGGTKFPILFMKWIEGPTLDSYVAEMLGRREVLLHLAAEWLKLVGALREARVAHGDLQHGNIIVERGRLRLVDHDGIFVPGMTGWSASELGHQHYQHPRRDAQLFDFNLDNFSALVIYLSLLALAEQPDLWAEHHDENLLFTRTDFIDPGASNLFDKIRQMGVELQRLSDILEEAAIGEPGAVPCLLDLVSVKSTLPAWMSAPLDIELKTKTREVIGDRPALDKKDSRWQPWQARQYSTSVPATTPSETFQTIFSGPATPLPSSGIAGINDPAQIWRNTPILAKELLTKNFLWWYWGIYLCLMFLGLDVFYSLLVALSCMAVICLTYGFISAQQLARAALQANPSAGNSLAVIPSTSSRAASATAPSLLRTTTSQLHPASITASDPIIANRALNIYHAADCAWVAQISPRNRISFLSTAEAVAAGYKPCHVCTPLKG